jgi:glycosyltransferase involved in cell wall biosynthesis
MRKPTDSVWIVIAARNEETAIGQVVAELRDRYEHVVVVDDGSTDRTNEVARQNGAHVLRHAINRGQGAALQTGMNYAVEHGARFVVTFDADGQHNPDDIPVMLARLEQGRADVALGSRFLGSAVGMPLQRKLTLRLATLFQKLTTGMDLTDAHNGLRLFSRRAAEAIRIQQDRMAHASEIIAQIGRLGLRYVEVPCTIRYTEYSIAKGQRLSGSLTILLDLAMQRVRL